jgi:hypothetical protein
VSDQPSNGGNPEARRRRNIALAKLALVGVPVIIVAALLIAGLLGSDDSSPALGNYTTGSSVANKLRSQLGEAGTGQAVANASCPNKRMAEGDSVTCNVTFNDGSFVEVEVTVEGFTPSGDADLQVDLAD